MKAWPCAMEANGLSSSPVMSPIIIQMAGTYSKRSSLPLLFFFFWLVLNKQYKLWKGFSKELLEVLSSPTQNQKVSFPQSPCSALQGRKPREGKTLPLILWENGLFQSQLSQVWFSFSLPPLPKGINCPLFSDRFIFPQTSLNSQKFCTSLFNHHAHADGDATRDLPFQSCYAMSTLNYKCNLGLSFFTGRRLSARKKSHFPLKVHSTTWLKTPPNLRKLWPDSCPGLARRITWSPIHQGPVVFYWIWWEFPPAADPSKGRLSPHFLSCRCFPGFALSGVFPAAGLALLQRLEMNFLSHPLSYHSLP